METIVKAKDQQAAEANKNASILLKELDLEKVLLNCDLGRGVQIPKCAGLTRFLFLRSTVPGGEQEASPGCQAREA